MYLYKVMNGSIRILSVFGYDGVVEIPDRIDGMPVAELAAYAFSEGRGAEAMLKKEGTDACFADTDGKKNGDRIDWREMTELKTTGNVSGIPKCGMERICGTALKEIYLPDTLKKIGNYAFYLCYELQGIHCGDSIEDLGSGLFTGCTGVREIDIRILKKGKSCLKEMLSELRQEIQVWYRSEKGTAELLFPEMFEESVENTPARIITWRMHGCGHRYRYCFDSGEFQFHRYDALFPHIQAQGDERVAVQLVMGRLRYPMGLYEQYREIYETYLRDHWPEAVRECLEAQSAELRSTEARSTETKNTEPCGRELYEWLAQNYGESRERLEIMVEMAGKYKNREAVSFLMDLVHRRFPAKRRTFSL